MYCNKCGQANPDDAVYCKKCGALMEAEEETRVATRENLPPGSPTTPSSTTPSAEAAATPPQTRRGALDATPPLKGGELGGEPDANIFSITPTLKFVYAGYVGAVVAAFLMVALVTILIPSVSAVFAVIIGLLLLLVPLYFHIKQKLVRYKLTDTTIEIDKGLISRSTQNIPLRRIQDVTVSSTLTQRMLGFGDIVIDNASEDGGKIVLDNIDSPRKYADLLLRQMKELDR